MYKSNVNLNLYKTFYDVAKLGSISKAAAVSYTSQPAISKSIKNLEEQLNTKLFYRKAQGVELTQQGEELLYYVEKSYSNLLTAERKMIETENLERGKLSIGMPSNIGTYYLFEKVIQFHVKYPNIEITIVTGGTSYLLDLLDSHKIDFIIDTAPIKTKNEDLIIKKLDNVRYCFAVKKDVRFIDYKKIKSLKDLKKVPLVLPIPGTSNRNMLDELLQKEHVEVENVLNIHTSEMILEFVKSELGIGYLIYEVIKDYVKNGEMEILDIKEKLPTVDIDICYNKNFLTTAPIKFIEDYIGHKIEV
ncbi:MAG: LysR family transcriptional regulator [Bacilli bacterium]|nr:LysR family transcriptional regulator [Bacilli bacterium]